MLDEAHPQYNLEEMKSEPPSTLLRQTPQSWVGVAAAGVAAAGFAATGVGVYYSTEHKHGAPADNANVSTVKEEGFAITSSNAENSNDITLTIYPQKNIYNVQNVDIIVKKNVAEITAHYNKREPVTSQIPLKDSAAIVLRVVDDKKNQGFFTSNRETSLPVNITREDTGRGLQVKASNNIEITVDGKKETPTKSR